MVKNSRNREFKNSKNFLFSLQINNSTLIERKNSKRSNMLFSKNNYVNSFIRSGVIEFPIFWLTLLGHLTVNKPVVNLGITNNFLYSSFLCESYHLDNLIL